VLATYGDDDGFTGRGTSLKDLFPIKWIGFGMTECDPAENIMHQTQIST